ncbi:hypothetical protein B296_00014324 [Ensete ventricosum]|uniref:BHLH domain-containing protein n=1 Tax=Ensete ventricosum TaxID=4639 RepID=A0A427B2W5_ENSVE|nr:hypothetical protein B296_00014324 [Ensete ventricosum]
MERSRRRKLNEKLYALRSLDKASIIKDAIDYVQQLQEQERTVLAELSQLESLREKKASLASCMQTDEMDSAQLKEKITTAISELDGSRNPISSIE